ncbi:hypothetical protein BKL50_04130 [Rodentibacter pneumotropicus]|uniref:Uncharacterized protein n=2 Tax=Pasteurellaceae TaxID=712 RepID=A0A1V3IA63_9PAST|nr:hypothetical protein BKK47_11515 [Rodentibacter mrazii]OOF63074.1 hypothetical protein BKL50_04130 [Rodentibacter pneumotropicus]THA19440.1 hypothetical protein D3M83_00140 [Rodentibacter pneumotropicus]
MLIKNCSLACPHCHYLIRIPLIKPIQWIKQCPHCQQAIKYKHSFGKSFITFLLGYAIVMVICHILLGEYPKIHFILGLIGGFITQHVLGDTHFEKEK